MTNRWTYLQFDVLHLDAQACEAVLAWVRELGLDPDRLHPQVTIVQHEDRYEAHFSQYLPGPHGGLLLDHNLGLAVTTPVVVPIDLNAAPRNVPRAALTA